MQTCDILWELFVLFTILLPSLSDEVMSTDQSLLKLILENHILKLKVTLSELYNGQLLETLAGKLLRVFIYRTVSYCNCVCVCVCAFDCVHLHMLVHVCVCFGESERIIVEKTGKFNKEKITIKNSKGKTMETTMTPHCKSESYCHAHYEVLTT